jgi:hypothetical protein
MAPGSAWQDFELEMAAVIGVGGTDLSVAQTRVSALTPRSTRARENTAHLCSRDDHPMLSVRATCRVDGIASLNRRHHGMLGVVWHQVRRILNAGRQRIRRCRFVKHDERRVIGSLDKWRHRRDDWS